jgi:glycerol-3-phosphate dehydrogenase (NAD(P)+)
MTKVAVLGAGSWGTTVANVLAERVPTVLWARSAAVADELRATRTNSIYLGDHELSASLGATDDLDVALDGATLIVVAVPSRGMRAVLERAAPSVEAGTPVLSLSKGLEDGTQLRMTEVIAACLGERPIGVLTGPNLAHEVLARQPTASVIALADEDLARELQGLFATDALRIYTNPDVVGCEISGVVKNVMAIAAGMVVGLGFGDNSRAALITRALAELARLGIALGGEPLTFSGLAGLGDLVATCTSPHSRNFAVGRALGEGRTIADALGSTRMVAEGVHSARPVVELARRNGVEVPVAEEVLAVCHDGRAPSEAIPRLMRRAAKSELEGIVR